MGIVSGPVIRQLIDSGAAKEYGERDGVTHYILSIPFILDNFVTRDTFASDYDCECDDVCECEPETFREVIDTKSFYADTSGLTDSIRDTGLQYPLIASIDGSGQIHQVDGHHRLASLITLGRDTAPYIFLCVDDYGLDYEARKSHYDAVFAVGGS